MEKVPFQTLFDAALTYQRYETVPGVTYKIKNPNDPNAPGLWFVEVPERLEIATHKSPGDPSIISGATREAHRSFYNFNDVIVPPGDAVYDVHIHFHGILRDMPVHYVDPDPNRKSYLPRSNSSHSLRIQFADEFGEEYKHKFMRERGALIQFHVPKALLDENYGFNAEENSYREKPFKKKFVEETILMKMSDGAVVNVPGGHDIVFRGGGYEIWDAERSSTDEWLIDGQRMTHYLGLAANGMSDKEKRDPAFSKKSGELFKATIRNLESRDKNPYEGSLLMARYISHFFNAKSGLVPDEAKIQFESFLEEAERKYAYFEAHPS